MDEAIKKAEVLIEALPYIRKFHRKIVVIKYGGSILGEEKIRRGVLEDIVFLSFMGLRPVLVHGGGPNISDRMRTCGKKTEFVDGMRVTDEETLKLVEEELQNLNDLIVKEIAELGAKAAGLNGKHQHIIQAEKKKAKIDLGCVGQISQIDTAAIEQELKNHAIVVVLPMGVGKDNKTYNVNADEAASSIAAALQAEKLVLLTNVRGIMRNPEDPHSFISALTEDEIKGLIEAGVIQSGMIPKVKACIASLDKGVKKTHIIDARIPHGLLLEIFTNKGVGDGDHQMKLQEVFDVYKENIMPTYTKVPLVFVKGKGSRLWDIHDKEYLDFFPGWGVGNLGHCHPKVMQAVRDQVSKLIFIPNNYYHIPQAKLARELVKVAFPSKVFFCNSGAEANEGAIKFARKFGQGRYEVITFENSFHGRTLAALAATGQVKYQQGFAPMPEGFKAVAFNDIKAVKAALTDKTAAIMLELIQGEGGVNVASEEFVKELRALCDERKMLLIFDEVQTGIGRTAKFFAYQHYGVVPDIMTLAKGLGGGLPIGMMVVKKEIADTLQPGMHASTFGGGPVIARAALAVLKAIQDEKLLRNAKAMGEYLFEKLNALKKTYPVIKDVRGMGLMAGVDLGVPGKQVVEKCLEHRLLINCTHDTVLRLMPALTITKKEIDKGVRILEPAIAGVKT